MSENGAGANTWQDPSMENPPKHGPEQPAGQRPRERADESRDFAQLPGTRLSWVYADLVTGRGALRTADQQTIASRSTSFRLAVTLSASGRTFTPEKVTGPAWSRVAGTTGYTPPRGGELWAKINQADLRLRQYVDETGAPALYTSGRHYNRVAGSRITFPDQRWLKFPVRGTKRTNATMTAVDHDGNQVASYRLTYRSGLAFIWMLLAVEITVHRGQPLTDELVPALAISAPWLALYVNIPH